MVPLSFGIGKELISNHHPSCVRCASHVKPQTKVQVILGSSSNGNVSNMDSSSGQIIPLIPSQWLHQKDTYPSILTEVDLPIQCYLNGKCRVKGGEQWGETILSELLGLLLFLCFFLLFLLTIAVFECMFRQTISRRVVSWNVFPGSSPGSAPSFLPYTIGRV